MSVKDDLIKAKALIDTPEKWRKGLPPLVPLCSGEALTEAISLRPTSAVSRRKASLVRALGFDDVEVLVAFNDDPATTHADIMALFDRAIEAA